jgi:hypothetical protein
MLTCKDATQLISRSMDASLPIVQRIRLRLHLLICEWCARYERQLFLIRETLRHFDAAGDRPEGGPAKPFRRMRGSASGNPFEIHNHRRTLVQETVLGHALPLRNRFAPPTPYG